MKLAKYWAKGEIDWMNVNPATAEKCRFFCWGWSNKSMEDAAEVGRQRASLVARQIQSGEKPDRYTYGDKALREQILDEWKGPDGSTYAAITINSYGCDIINTTNVMFVDIDIKDSAAKADEEMTALATLDKVLKNVGGIGAHVYRTAGGLRYIITKQGAVPNDPAVIDLMKRLGSDPLYITLCRVQECFRARLTPKAWRCGLPAFGAKFPWAGTRDEARVTKWRDKYRQVSERYAVCKYIGYLGPAVNMPAEFNKVVEFHDRMTKAGSGLDLA